EILNRAKLQAEEIIRESNKRIENAIKEIREKQAEKEETKRIRQQLAEYEANILEATPSATKKTQKGKAGATQIRDHGLLSDDDFQKKI
ncbi:hypothetical protein QP561_11310, partial [Veillonella nakazawae]|nr:hypothetical protein [Veillonella nakazawae]